MKLKTIEKLCCPFDKHDLTLQVLAKDTTENIIEGILSCTHCQRKYPIVYGVPIMAPDEYRQIPLEQPILERWKLEYGINDLKLLP
ncbi:Trm112 family protein [uncultured Mucilaginibacter sp.]|uniref:Trm112 family protein n=1 Tax=uncultured Mucilaginibacter sp. TaxID=797541 RepID=UPI0025DB453B|nr:Trm112 family protein [uncultured Mucilaginibacter sp.]